jgi:hypothetical protein
MGYYVAGRVEVLIMRFDWAIDDAIQPPLPFHTFAITNSQEERTVKKES